MNSLSKFLIVSVRLLLAALLGALALWGGTAPSRAQSTYEVVILVVDDFSGASLAPGSYAADEACAVSLEGQAFAVRGVSADPIPVPHGDLVYAQLEELISEAGAEGFVSLVPVDIQGVTTTEAALLLAEALDGNPADVYVANMSFAIIPCEYIQAFADFGAQLMDARTAKDLNRHRSLFQRAVVFYNGTVFPAMSRRAQRATDLDPIQTLLAGRGAALIPVASAGNFGLDFPFWPAAWGQAVSVSASFGQGYHAPSAWDKKNDTPLLTADPDKPGKQMRISNYGEVMIPGEYMSEYGLVSGTSFAAPRLSVALALYASAVGTGTCRNAQGGPALASGKWDNLTLQQAVQAYCPAMAPYLPAS
ncbi:MAG: S8 family serine peptidase [Chloroflexota bacterium]